MTAAQLALGRALQRGRGLARALADFELPLVVPLLLLGLAQPRLLGVALVGVAGFWVARRLAWQRFTARTVGDGSVVVLLLLLPVTLWVTALPAVTQQQVLWLLTGIALYYAIVNWTNTAERERGLMRVVIALALLAALIAPFTVVWVTDIKLTFIPERVYAALPLLAPIPMHPNVLAGVLALAFPIPLALLLFEARRMKPLERLAAFAAVVAIAAILLLTKSRGAMLAGMVAALALCLLRWRHSWMFMLLAALLGVLALSRAGLDPLMERLAASRSLVGVPGRLEIWSRAIYLIQNFPFTGIGMGTFQDVANTLYPFFLLGPDADVPHAHNLFLQVAVDLGIPGFLAWFSLLFLTARSAWRVRIWGNRRRDGWSAGLGAGLLGSQLALVVHGALDAPLWGAHSGIVVWVLWGVCAAAYNLRRQ